MIIVNIRKMVERMRNYFSTLTWWLVDWMEREPQINSNAIKGVARLAREFSGLIAMSHVGIIGEAMIGEAYQEM
ncbi:hypothetical protein CARUB_v10028680mg [Capsella rubella]|uniref:Uncharacterized protein n=1 Tax=Capsella rubella TaxID=81985 RepID=R0GSG3_9BRAS|nr:hypothetical protein CARUB_v10028680mg [Capsella rubella]